MSADAGTATDALHPPHGSAAHGFPSAYGGTARHDSTAAHGTLKSYLIGFALSVVLTVIPFWLVMSGALDDREATGLIIAALAMGQIVVHMICFLHMNARSEGGWTLMALIFTIIMVVITLAGSLWVMHHLNANMMPAMHAMSPQDMSAMP